MKDALRYARRTPLSIDDDLDNVLLKNEVAWLKEFQKGKFFQFASNINLNKDPLYQSGRLIGMDAASVATVWALQAQPGMTVLDTCCAPGMKFMLVSDCVGKDGVLVGLDVSEQRLDVCRNLLDKFGYSDRRNSIFLMPQNWTFQQSSDWINSCGGQSFNQVVEKRKRRKKKRSRVNNEDSIPNQFDRVLVDAECTHDGSARHTSKQEDNGFWSRHSKSEKNRNFFDNEENLKNLTINQRRLILNGFRLLKPGGIMVYSTCSLQKAQNQDIVEWLINEVGDEAEMGILPFTNSDIPMATFFNDYSCLFDPSVSGTSGQFISIIRKRVS